MTTVLEVVKQFCVDNHKCIVPPDKRNLIGQRVASYWYGTYKNAENLPRIPQNEPEGQFEVVVYPDWFSPKIYEIVEKFYDEMRANRKKIPIKSQPFTKLHRASWNKKV